MAWSTKSVRNNVENGGVFTYKKPFQKVADIDNEGNLWLLVIDEDGSGNSTMYIYKWTDGGSYTNPTNASMVIRDDFKAATASMIFDLERKILKITYEWCVGGETKEIRYIEYDTVNDSFGNTATITANSTAFMPDICIDSDGNVHGVYNDADNYYLWFVDPGGGLIGPLTFYNVTSLPGGAGIVCKDNIMYLMINVSLALFTSNLYIFPALSTHVVGTTVSVGAFNCVHVVDNVGDVHIVGYSTDVYKYYKYDYSAGTLSSVTELIATGNDFDAASGFGICARWDESNNRPDLYAFYSIDNTPHDIFYKKFTTSWSAAVNVDITPTGDVAFLNVYRAYLPATVDTSFLMCSFLDNDGATPYPVEAAHSGAILSVAPSVGGYYTPGRISRSIVMGINLDGGGWERRIQSKPIVALITGVRTVDTTPEGIISDSNEGLVFSTGYDAKEYDADSFDDEDEPITCLLTEEHIDFGAKDIPKNIEVMVPRFESGGDFTIVITNESGSSKKFTISRANSGKKHRVNFRGKVVTVSVYESSIYDFKLYGIRFYASTSQTII